MIIARMQSTLLYISLEPRTSVVFAATETAAANERLNYKSLNVLVMLDLKLHCIL